MSKGSAVASALLALALASPASTREIDEAAGWPPVYSAEAGKGRARVDSALRVAIEYPEAGQEVVGPDNRGFVTGTAYQSAKALGSFDIYVVLDVSDSTKRPSGADIDGDGLVGVDSRGRRIPLIGVLFDSASNDPGDSVLACEVKAAKTLLGQLDSESTRVGLIRFSGDYDNATPMPRSSLRSRATTTRSRPSSTSCCARVRAARPTSWRRCSSPRSSSSAPTSPRARARCSASRW